MQILDAAGKDITHEKPWFNNASIKNKLAKGNPYYTAITCGHWSMLFSKRFIQDYSVKYSTLACGEEGLFYLKVFLNTNNISFCDETVYHYCMRPGSLSDIENLERHMIFGEALKERVELLKSKGLADTDYAYVTNYANYCLKTFKEYLQGREAGTDAITEKYLGIIENAINRMEEPQRVFEALPRYQELKTSRY